MQKNRLSGKWALVTGSSRGIGQKIAIGLAEQGCNLIIHGRTLANTQKTVELLREFNIQVLSCEGDVGKEQDLDTIIKFVIDKVGGIDILYNNAAIMSKAQKIWEVPLDYWKYVFDINFFSVVKLCAAFAPRMRIKKYGRIINISSGIVNQPEQAAYSATKAAIDKYTRDLAFEYRNDNVLINYLDPGWLKTDLGGPNADHEVDTVLYGAIVPALLEDNGPTGRGFSAQDFKYLK